MHFRHLSLLTLILLTARFAHADPSPVFELHAASTNPGPTARAFVPPGASPDTTAKIYVEPEILLDGSAIRAAEVTEDKSINGPGIQIYLTTGASKRFGEITTKYVRQQLAIMINGKLVSAPMVVSPIFGGQVSIRGNFTTKEATELAASLNASVAAPSPASSLPARSGGDKLGVARRNSL